MHTYRQGQTRMRSEAQDAQYWLSLLKARIQNVSDVLSPRLRMPSPSLDRLGRIFRPLNKHCGPALRIAVQARQAIGDEVYL